MSEPLGPTPDEKRAALEEVLRTSVLARSDQLRSFLRYVCEMDLLGRSDDLNEYLIGVEALGKPPGYSTAEDAAVRRRAHELREKLEEVYAGELLGARLRIELPKGRYVPRFVALPPPPPAAAPVPIPVPDAVPSVAPRRPHAWLMPVAWMVVGAALASAGFWWARARAAAVDPVLAEAWGPLLAPGGNVRIAVASPAHYNVLPYPEGPLPEGVHLVPDEWDLANWYRGHYPLKEGSRLGLHLSGPLRTGEVLGMMTAARVLTRAHAEYAVMLDKKLSLSTVRGWNLIFFGNPEYSDLAAALLERGVWTIDYDPASRARVVQPRAGSGQKAFAPGPDWQRPATFGLITVLTNAETVVPSEAPRTAPRIVLISCTNSQGCQAAAELFASPGALRPLRDRFRAEGHATFPPAYQVVVRCDLRMSQAVSGAYEAHAVLPAS